MQTVVAEQPGLEVGISNLQWGRAQAEPTALYNKESKAPFHLYETKPCRERNTAAVKLGMESH